MNQAEWFVYILKCADGSLYTGITNDLARRLERHLEGKASRYTRARLPVALVYREPHPDRSSASIREAAIKRLPRPDKEALIQGNR
ncbi:GIY-YIG nuclease family protein [bacterium]|nr:MAG: GIY-YIG nuclease family protein [bacterium]